MNETFSCMFNYLDAWCNSINSLRLQRHHSHINQCIRCICKHKANFNWEGYWFDLVVWTCVWPNFNNKCQLHTVKAKSILRNHLKGFKIVFRILFVWIPPKHKMFGQNLAIIYTKDSIENFHDRKRAKRIHQI